MNINFRALVFGAIVAAALTAAMNVVAAERPQIVRLDGIEVTAHRAPDAGVIRLEGITVTAHKAAAEL